jgi:3-oxoacyl-[acyl-carrier-protein] synthase II
MKTDSIVITGVGLVTSLGTTAEQTWQNVLSQRASLGPMPALETPAPDDKGGYQAMDLPTDLTVGFPATLPREIRYLRWTIQQAMVGAQITDALPYEPSRCGCVLGTTLHGMRAGGQFLRSGDFDQLKTFLAGNVLQMAVADLPLRGDAITTCSACSSSLGSIALAVTMLETGQLDLVIAGGYDTVSEYAYGGFNALRLVADGPLRSFARDRRGMKLGEGYGVVILERATEARQRGAKLLATIAGCGESADAHHLTQPDPNGRGAAAAISDALNRAGLQPREIQLIAAHATGTPDNDAGEYAAFSSVFGEQLPNVPVIAFKTHVGHTLGGAGAVELILSMCALRDQTVSPCANVATSDVDFPGLSLAVGQPQPAKISHTLSTSLGFGGANTCVVLSHATDRAAKSKPQHEVCITGIGVLLPGAIGLDAFRALLQSKTVIERDTGPLDESLYLHLLNARRVRRMSTYVKLSLAATALACTDAGFTEQSPLAGDCSVLLGSTHGSASFCVDYYRQIVEGGFIAANPSLFAEGVPNAAAAHLSLMLGMKGACQTVIGSRTAGLDALRLATLRIASGQWDRAIVGAAEEYLPLINEGYRKCGLYSGTGGDGFATGSGAVSLILENREAMRRRGGKCRGVVGVGASVQLRTVDAVNSIASVLSRLGGMRKVFTSANHTWIDRAEMLGIRKAKASESIEQLYGRLPELFSVGPLAAVAAGLVSNAEASYGVICCGYDGVVSGAGVTRTLG